MLKKIILLVFLLSSILSSDTLSIDSQKFIFKDFHISKFIDSSNKLSIEDIQTKDFNTTVPNAYSNGFVPHKSIWHKFSITNNLSQKMEFVFNDNLYYLPAERDVYIINSKNKIVDSYFGGYNRNDDKQTKVEHSSSFFRLPLEPNETYTFFIKTYFQNGNSSIYNYSVYDVDSHIDSMIYTNILSAFLLGGILTLIFYNFSIFVYSKDKTYLYYVAYLFFSFVIGFVFISGFVYKFFNITHNSWIHNATYATPLTIIFILIFTSKIFEMKKFYPKINKSLTTSIYLVMIYVISSMLFGLLAYLPIIMGFALIIGFAIVVLGIYMTYTKNKLGMIYLVSTAGYAIFAIITIIYYLGLLPTNIFTSNVLMIGSLIEGIGLSLLLAYRINILKKENNSLEVLSSTDGLTGLYNRRYFNDVAPREINKAKEGKKIVAFTILDVDNFKSYNDTYGHQEGDNVLIEIAKSLQKTFQRSGDFIFRIGGEEFGVICSAKSVDDIKTLFENARKNIEALQIEHSLNLPYKVITASFGLSISDLESSIAILDIDKIYKEADDLLYLAKESGKNTICTNIGK